MGFRAYESSILAGLRVAELPLSLLVWTTELAYKATFSYEAYCPISDSFTGGESYKLTFPFYEKTIQISQDLCATDPLTPTIPFQLTNDHSPEAISALIIGVLTTWHAVISLIIFFLFWLNVISWRYRRTMMTVDFVASLIFTLAWLAISIAWMIGSVRFVNEISEKSIREKASVLSPCNLECAVDPPVTSGQSCCYFSFSSAVPVIYASPIGGLIIFIVYLIELPFLIRKTHFWNQMKQNKTKHRRFSDANPVWTTNAAKEQGVYK